MCPAQEAAAAAAEVAKAVVVAADDRPRPEAGSHRRQEEVRLRSVAVTG